MHGSSKLFYVLQIASSSELGFDLPGFIAEFQIKKGWIVNVDARGIHYDSTIYNDPTDFIPSRFDVSYSEL